MKKENKGRVSIIIVLACIALVGYLIINNVQLIMEKNSKEDYTAEQLLQITAQDKENAELEKILKSENESKYLEQYAREELDYIMPGERVYADSIT